MSDSHIIFSQMSDFFDDQIHEEEERLYISDHLNCCEECNSEFIRLKKTITLVSMLRNEEYNLPGLSLRSVTIAKSRSKKRTFLKAVPAMAAALVIAGIFAIQTDIFRGRGEVAKNLESRNLTIPDKTGPELVVKMISNLKGKVLEVADQYVEGEIEYHKFIRLSRELENSGFYKIKYRIVADSDPMSRHLNSGTRHKLMQNIEEVGAGDIPLQSDGNKVMDPSKQSVRFRVYK